VLELVAAYGAEQVALTADPETGLRAIVAIHSTVLGPSLGGTRFRPYTSETEALTDVLRLARGMTFKHAACGNVFGGGKAVIIGDPATFRTDALIRAYARFVDRLGGRYLTAEDVGTTQADMDLIRTITPFATGASEDLGGSGDPSPATAWGVLHALSAVAAWLWDDESLHDRRVAISGVGKVGHTLAGYLAEAGARLTIADVRAHVATAVAKELDAEVVDASSIHRVSCDIYSPCALGAVLNETTIPELRCVAVCGCANNQLATPEDGQRLAARGVLYAPDYVVNAGGVINIAHERDEGGYDHDRAWKHIAAIGETLTKILTLADEQGVTPSEAADSFAEARLAAAT
jgi:glutamate dehydrogenase/leucine dehydrogenase